MIPKTLLTLGPHWGDPMVGLCCGDPEVLGLQVRSLHVLQQIIDGLDDGVGPVSLGLMLGSYGFGLLGVKFG